MNGGKVATFFFWEKRKSTKVAENETNIDLTIQIERK